MKQDRLTSGSGYGGFGARSKMRRKLPLLIAIGVATLLSSCGGDSSEPDASAGEAETSTTIAAAPTTTVAAPATTLETPETTEAGPAELEEVRFLLGPPAGLSYTVEHVAELFDLYEEFGVTLAVESTGGGGFTIQQLVAGNADYGVPGAGNVFSANEEGSDLRFLSCLHQDNLFRVIAVEGSGVTSIDDLAGQVVGITELGGGEYPTVLAALGTAGLSEQGDVELLPIGEGGPQTAAALLDGVVAAFAGSSNDIVALESAGIAVVDITPEELINVPGACLVATQSAIDENPELAQQVTDLWVRALEISVEEPDAVFDYICEEEPDQCDNAEFARSLFDRNVNQMQPSPEVTIGRVSASALENLATILHDAGVIQDIPDVGSMIASQALQE